MWESMGMRENAQGWGEQAGLGMRPSSSMLVFRYQPPLPISAHALCLGRPEKPWPSTLANLKTQTLNR